MNAICSHSDMEVTGSGKNRKVAGELLQIYTQDFATFSVNF